MELPPDNPGVQVVGMGNSGGELFNKSCCYFYVAVEGFGKKRDGLIGMGFRRFPMKGIEYALQA